MQLYDRIRSAVYWEEEPTEVRRCSWFYKGDSDSRFIPYSEEFSDKLEVCFTLCPETNMLIKCDIMLFQAIFHPFLHRLRCAIFVLKSLFEFLF